MGGFIDVDIALGVGVDDDDDGGGDDTNNRKTVAILANIMRDGEADRLHATQSNDETVGEGEQL